MGVVVLKGVNKMKKIITIGIIIIFCILLFTSHAYAADDVTAKLYEITADNHQKIYEQILDKLAEVSNTDLFLENDKAIGDRLDALELDVIEMGYLLTNIENLSDFYKNNTGYSPTGKEEGKQYLSRVASVITNTQDYEQPSTGTGTGTSTSTNNKFSFPSIGELFQKASDFIGLGASGETIGDDDLVDPTLQIGRVLMTIAIIVLLIVTIIMAIKYMIANPEEQGKLKQQLVGLVISAAVIFGAYIIWQITINLLTNVTQ